MQLAKKYVRFNAISYKNYVADICFFILECIYIFLKSLSENYNNLSAHVAKFILIRLKNVSLRVLE